MLEGPEIDGIVKYVGLTAKYEGCEEQDSETRRHEL